MRDIPWCNVSIRYADTSPWPVTSSRWSSKFVLPLRSHAYPVRLPRRLISDDSLAPRGVTAGNRIAVVPKEWIVRPRINQYSKSTIDVQAILLYIHFSFQCSWVWDETYKIIFLDSKTLISILLWKFVGYDEVELFNKLLSLLVSVSIWFTFSDQNSNSTLNKITLTKCQKKFHKNKFQIIAFKNLVKYI